MTITTSLPSPRAMYDALVRRDPSFEGVFVAAIRTTGIACRPTCPAKKPLLQNVEFFPSIGQALTAGYRPCKRCRPLRPNGDAPEWLTPLLEAVERDPSRRWTDRDLRSLGVEPSSVRRWFRAHHGMTFHGYQRARRLGRALGQIRQGQEVSRTAYDHGFDSESGFRDAFVRWFGKPPGQTRSTRCLVVNRLLTPLGPMVAGAVDEGICLLEFGDRRALETQIRRLTKRLACVVAPGTHPLLDTLDTQLREYFDGARRDFTVPLEVPGTDFQRACWAALRDIPFGDTRSYDEQARAIGKPTAVRAVGRANGDNRLAILIPCHRVVRADGQLAGYGGGLWRKKALLDLEGRVRTPSIPS